MANLTRDVIKLIRNWRQTGSTTIMMNGAINEPCFLLASDEMYGEMIRKKYGIKDRSHLRVIPYRGLYARIHEVDGKKLPMVIDNSFLLSFAEDANNTIRSLEFGKLSDIQEIEKLQSQLKESKDWEILQKNKALVRFYQTRSNQSIIREAQLKVKLLISKEETRQSPYFYVPLTIFLFFYFIMFIYIISNFIF